MSRQFRNVLSKRPQGASFEELRSAYLARYFDLDPFAVLAAVKAWNRMDDQTKKTYSIYVRVAPG